MLALIDAGIEAASYGIETEDGHPARHRLAGPTDRGRPGAQGRRTEPTSPGRLAIVPPSHRRHRGALGAREG